MAGGNGTRMGNELPKQFLLVKNLPIIMHTINCFAEYEAGIEIVVVLPDSQIEYWERLCKKFQFSQKHQVVAGGDSRFQSVKNGIDTIVECDLVAIHDGVRPLVGTETIERCFESAAKHGAAIPVLPANESLREGTMNQSVAVDRTRYFQVQTPQVFSFDLIKKAYLQPFQPEFTDDASVVEKMGVSVQMVLGNRENIKITHPEDLLIAELFLGNK